MSRRCRRRGAGRGPDIVPTLGSGRGSVSVRVGKVDNRITSLCRGCQSSGVDESRFMKGGRLLTRRGRGLRDSLSVIRTSVRGTTVRRHGRTRGLRTVRRVITLARVSSRLLTSEVCSSVRVVMIQSGGSLSVG